MKRHINLTIVADTAFRELDIGDRVAEFSTIIDDLSETLELKDREYYMALLACLLDLKIPNDGTVNQDQALETIITIAKEMRLSWQNRELITEQDKVEAEFGNQVTGTVN